MFQVTGLLLYAFQCLGLFGALQQPLKAGAEFREEMAMLSHGPEGAFYALAGWCSYCLPTVLGMILFACLWKFGKNPEAGKWGIGGGVALFLVVVFWPALLRP